MQLIAPDGVPVRFEVSGEGVPLLLLHGFTGSGSAWNEVVGLLGDTWRTVRPDVRGHGGSWRPGADCSMDAQVADLVSVLDSLGLQRAVVCGYSMGARLALHFTVVMPGRVAALVMESGSPGILDDSERGARVASDEALAERLEHEGIEAFVDGWMALPLFASQRRLGDARLAELRAARLQQDPAGLAASLRGMGTGSQPSLWGRLHEVRKPVLLLAGQDDEKYAEIAVRMGGLLPDAHVELVQNAGHAVHLEAPSAWAVWSGGLRAWGEYRVWGARTDERVPALRDAPTLILRLVAVDQPEGVAHTVNAGAFHQRHLGGAPCDAS